MLGVSLPRITSQRIYLEGACVLYVDVTHDDTRCQRVPRPRASNAACAAEVYNDHIIDIKS